MSFYYYLLLIPVLIIFFLIRSFVLSKKDITVSLFMEALKDENNGNLEAAISTYQRALNESKKRRRHSKIQDKILEKLKLLHTLIEHNKNVHFTRQPNQH